MTAPFIEAEISNLGSEFKGQKVGREKTERKRRRALTDKTQEAQGQMKEAVR